MHRLRHLVLANRPFACAVLALALMMKIVMPAGFMPTMSGGQIVVSVCSGMGPTTMVMTIPGLGDGKSEDEGHHGKAEQPCAFSGLSAPSLAAADPVLLAAAILFVLALGTRSVVPLASPAPPYLRPPLRGPPAF
ncbi:DUF2946 family protein [Sphingobium sp. UBA5915]|uniref:DUF2946 family protein n=1 Tax=Sphingobium sp. UBA5915 TaxID=1947530 RepID=UPI0025D1FC4A|nr:DUF2946 family protein [Sphingobium sp. UBA5915]